MHCHDREGLNAAQVYIMSVTILCELNGSSPLLKLSTMKRYSKFSYTAIQDSTAPAINSAAYSIYTAGCRAEKCLQTADYDEAVRHAEDGLLLADSYRNILDKTEKAEEAEDHGEKEEKKEKEEAVGEEAEEGKGARGKYEGKKNEEGEGTEEAKKATVINEAEKTKETDKPDEIQETGEVNGAGEIKKIGELNETKEIDKTEVTEEVERLKTCLEEIRFMAGLNKVDDAIDAVGGESDQPLTEVEKWRQNEKARLALLDEERWRREEADREEQSDLSELLMRTPGIDEDDWLWAQEAKARNEK